MKTRKPHRVPLSKQAFDVLQKARERTHGTGIVFRGATGKRLDGSKLRLLLKRLGVEATVHGFRGSFKSWCMEHNVERAVAELSLAHAYMGNVESAYVRTDMLEQRRPVMAAWGAHVTANSIKFIDALARLLYNTRARSTGRAPRTRKELLMI